MATNYELEQVDTLMKFWTKLNELDKARIFTAMALVVVELDKATVEDLVTYLQCHLNKEGAH